MFKNLVRPRAVFIIWLAGLDRLSMASRLHRWGMVDDSSCRIYSNGEENIDHIFVLCYYVKEVRKRVFSFLQYDLQHVRFCEELNHMAKLNKKSTDKAKLITCLWTELMYVIWDQKNSKAFGKGLLSPRDAAKQDIFHVSCRVNDR